MTIQVTLNANEFNRTGEYNDRQYTSLRVKSVSNGRIYFFTINNQMKLTTMAKQMKCEDGIVFVSFGKNDKLGIGTYVDSEVEVMEETPAIEEEEAVQSQDTFNKNEAITTNTPDEAWNELKQGKQVLMNDNEIDQLQSYIETLSDEEADLYYSNFVSLFDKSLACGLLTRHYVCKLKGYAETTQQETPSNNSDEKTLIDTFTTNQYKIELFSSLDQHNHRYVLLGEVCYKYHLIFTDLNTGEINEELSDIIYLSLEAAQRVINSHVDTKPVQTTKKESEQSTIQPKQAKQPIIPKINMIADHATILYTSDKLVNIVFTNNNETNTVTFIKRKAWSHRKYIDKAIEESGIKPSWEFKYGWEYVAV